MESKRRVSHITEQHEQTLQSLRLKRLELVQKFTRTPNAASNVNLKKKLTTTKCLKIEAPVIQEIPKIETINEANTANRATAHMRQWGVRANVDVEKVKLLAQKLKQQQHPQTKIKRISFYGYPTMTK